ncbi:MAG: amidase [Hyphomicrobium sp.]|uniref:amidase n=1 Tax=Hyphomicrobium sp. TaxID=82 RepID=UPI003D0C37ED
MSDSDLCYLGAAEALRRFKARRLSPVELVDALAARIERVGPKVNAFTYVYAERARAAARRAEARYAKTDGRLRPLEGLPVVIKDDTAIAGDRTTYGSLLYKDNIDETTAPSADRILKAGALLLGRSTTPEFAAAGICWSRLWGVTATPWNLRYSAGGSSGGAGAALAAGLTTLANGTDIGGSVRIPAAACGIYGFKPPYGRNPEAPAFNLDWYNHAGPMARSVADCALLQNVMSGPDPRDIAAIRPKLRIPKALDRNLKGWRIAYSPALDIFEVDREVAARTEAAVEAFRSMGAMVEEVELGWPPSIAKAAADHLGAIFGAWIAETFAPKERRHMTSYVRAFAASPAPKLIELLASMETEGRMFEKLGALFRRYRLLLCPTTALPSMPAAFDPAKDSARINGKPVDSFFGVYMTWPFNMMSRCPVMSVPSGFAKSGVPTGLQIVGRPFDDVSVFRAAAAFEMLHPLYDKPIRRPKL